MWFYYKPDSTDKPFFYWKGVIKPAPLIFVTGTDKFDGTGNLKIKIFGLFTIGNKKGTESDKAELLRYLAEMLWFPTSVLSDFVTWEEIDPLTAKGIIVWEGINVEATFYFAEDGRLINTISKRYMDKGRYETWETPVEGYADFNGYLLPYKGPAIYKLEEGDFKYIDIEITDIEFNVKEIY